MEAKCTTTIHVIHMTLVDDWNNRSAIKVTIAIRLSLNYIWMYFCSIQKDKNQMMFKKYEKRNFIYYISWQQNVAWLLLGCNICLVNMYMYLMFNGFKSKVRSKQFWGSWVLLFVRSFETFLDNCTLESFNIQYGAACI